MKKDILFIMNSLTNGGAENSLVSLLQEFDYENYNVDLLLFKKSGFFLDKLPKQVNLLDAPPEFNYFDMSTKKALWLSFIHLRWDVFIARLLFVFIVKTEKKNAVKEQKIWKAISFCYKKINKRYDVSVGFLEKTPNYFCVDKTNATIKIGFLRTDYEMAGMDPKLDLPYFKKLNMIFANSSSAHLQLQRIFPQFAAKIHVVENVFSKEAMVKMSNVEVEIKKAKDIIVSVGRLEPEKNFELAVETCKILVEKGHDIVWYIFGEGQLRVSLQELINRYNLQKNMILSGHIENIYPYLKKATIYVHTSKFEGKSRAIQEAKILGRPIVSTNFPAIKDQIQHDVNGLVAQMNAVDMANNIGRLLVDKKLQLQFEQELDRENLSTQDGLKVFYSLINGYK